MRKYEQSVSKKQPTNQPTNQPANQPTNQPTTNQQPTKQPTNNQAPTTNANIFKRHLLKRGSSTSRLLDRSRVVSPAMLQTFEPGIQKNYSLRQAGKRTTPMHGITWCEWDHAKYGKATMRGQATNNTTQHNTIKHNTTQ
jgi:hypothetical protein